MRKKRDREEDGGKTFIVHFYLISDCLTAALQSTDHKFAPATAAVAQLGKFPELRSLKEVKLN